MWAMCSGESPERVPREVTYFLLCKEMKCLPGVGGLLDQDPALVEAFILCLNVQGRHQKFTEEKEKQAARHKEKVKEAKGQG